MRARARGAGVDAARAARGRVGRRVARRRSRNPTRAPESSAGATARRIGDCNARVELQAHARVRRRQVASRRRYPPIVDHLQDVARALSGHAAHRTERTPTSTGTRACEAFATRPGMDRDEYPPAVSAEGGAGADVRLVRSSENRSAGAVIRPFCDGQRFVMRAGSESAGRRSPQQCQGRRRAVVRPCGERPGRISGRTLVYPGSRGVRGVSEAGVPAVNFPTASMGAPFRLVVRR